MAGERNNLRQQYKAPMTANNNVQNKRPKKFTGTFATGFFQSDNSTDRANRLVLKQDKSFRDKSSLNSDINYGQHISSPPPNPKGSDFIQIVHGDY